MAKKQSTPRLRGRPAPAGMPTIADLLRPTVQALADLGGSGSIDEISRRVIEIEKLPDSVTSVLHNPDNDTRTVVEYRLAWARTHLKNADIIENSARGVWALRSSAIKASDLDPAVLIKKAQEKVHQSSGPTGSQGLDDEASLDGIEPWRHVLHRIVTQEISPAAFERLTMRLLREAGFTQVEVTGRSGDGGIDGKGIARVSGVLSFHVVFQCKRYKGTVTPGQVRDFRGAMQGRADKGILITTGSFTKDAIREATRDGAPAIDLVDGDRLADMLKELRLGITTELVERVTVDPAWFGGLESESVGYLTKRGGPPT